MKIKTSELEGAALDWAVTKCTFIKGTGRALIDPEVKPYGTDWAYGGPIIEREGMGVWMYQWNEQGEPEAVWYAEDKNGDHVQTGPTPLIAAMRCYVASKLGNEVDIPEELV